MKLKNEFFEISIGKDWTTITLLDGDGKPQPAAPIKFTNIEFDNLCHTITKNKDRIHKKICYEYTPKSNGKIISICDLCREVNCPDRCIGLVFCKRDFEPIKTAYQKTHRVIETKTKAYKLVRK